MAQDQLLAELEGQASTNANDETHEAMHVEADATESHEAEGQVGHEEAEGDVFSTILGKNMGDHDSFGFYDVFHLDLPKIIIDDGFHFYANGESMEEAGLFTTEHHHIVRTSDNEAPSLDLSITSLVVFEWIAMILLFILFRMTGKKYKKDKLRKTSGLQTVMEFYVDFVKNKIVRPNVGSDKLTNQLAPYFISLYFFILFMNLLGLVPGGHSPTGNLAVTAALAVTAFIVINIVSIKEIGAKAYFHHLLGGAPWWLFPIMVPIEILSMFTKPFALTVRLFANMTAGHVIILCLIGLIFFFQTVFLAAVSVPFSLFIYALELLVGFIQAYVFTVLSAVFVGLALGDHAHEDHVEHQH